MSVPLEVHVLPAPLEIIVAWLSAVGGGWTVLWHVGERQRVRHEARHDKRRADSLVLTKGDSPVFFPWLRDIGIGRHCPFDDKAVRWRHERLASLLSHHCW